MELTSVKLCNRTTNTCCQSVPPPPPPPPSRPIRRSGIMIGFALIRYCTCPYPVLYLRPIFIYIGPSGEPITELSPLLHEKVKSSTPSEQIKWNSHQTENGAIEMPPPVDVPKASTNEVLSSSTNECDNVETTQLLAKIRAICMVLALTVHSVLEGLVVGLQDTAQGVSEIVVMIGIHKVIVAFSLGITLLKSERSKLAHIGKAVSIFPFISLKQGERRG